MTMQKYSEVMRKALAFQVSASVYKPIDCKRMQGELTTLLKARMDEDYSDMQTRTDRLEQYIEQRVAALSPELRFEYTRLLADISPMTEISSLSAKIDTLLQKTVTIGETVQARQYTLVPVNNRKQEAISVTYQGAFTTPNEKPKRTTQTSKKSFAEKSEKVLEFFKNTYPVGVETTGREVARRMGVRASEIKSVTDSMRYLYIQGELKRKMIRNKFYYWRES